MLTRRMATQIEKKVAQILMRSLIKDPSGRRRISWYEVTDIEWDILKPILLEIRPGREPYRDTETLGELYDKWIAIIHGANDAKRLQLDEAALQEIPNLPVHKEGLQIWYEAAREATDPPWENIEPPENDQKWAVKLSKIVDEGKQALGVMLMRSNNAETILNNYKNFMRLRAEYGTDQIKIKVEIGEVTVEQVTASIRSANTTAGTWLGELNEFYDWNPSAEQRNDFKLYFAGQGFNMTGLHLSKW